MSEERDKLTPLESDLLQNFHRRYHDIGFPAAEQISVKSRAASTAGRITYMDHDGLIRRPDGQLDLGAFSQFNMDGLDAGASFTVEIEEGKILYLDITVNGDAHWDGSEREWIICDPDTGQFP
jgi:hypothetical protein